MLIKYIDTILQTVPFVKSNKSDGFYHSSGILYMRKPLIWKKTKKYFSREPARTSSCWCSSSEPFRSWKRWSYRDSSSSRISYLTCIKSYPDKRCKGPIERNLILGRFLIRLKLLNYPELHILSFSQPIRSDLTFWYEQIRGYITKRCSDSRQSQDIQSYDLRVYDTKRYLWKACPYSACWYSPRHLQARKNYYLSATSCAIARIHHIMITVLHNKTPMLAACEVCGGRGLMLQIELNWPR